MEYQSERVKEVIELKDLLEKNHIIEHASLRLAIECVYGLKDDFYRHNPDIDVKALAKAEDLVWDNAYVENLKAKRAEE